MNIFIISSIEQETKAFIYEEKITEDASKQINIEEGTPNLSNAHFHRLRAVKLDRTNWVRYFVRIICILVEHLFIK